MVSITDDHILRIRRNLSDVGCDSPFIEKFLLLEQKERRREQLHLLAQHRLSLLEELHRDQYRIDCLDHMVYIMEQEMEVSENGRKAGFDKGMG